MLKVEDRGENFVASVYGCSELLTQFAYLHSSDWNSLLDERLFRLLLEVPLPDGVVDRKKFSGKNVSLFCMLQLLAQFTEILNVMSLLTPARILEVESRSSGGGADLHKMLFLESDFDQKSVAAYVQAARGRGRTVSFDSIPDLKEYLSFLDSAVLTKFSKYFCEGSSLVEASFSKKTPSRDERFALGSTLWGLSLLKTFVDLWPQALVGPLHLLTRGNFSLLVATLIREGGKDARLAFPLLVRFGGSLVVGTALEALFKDLINTLAETTADIRDTYVTPHSMDFLSQVLSPLEEVKLASSGDRPVQSLASAVSAQGLDLFAMAIRKLIEKAEPDGNREKLESMLNELCEHTNTDECLAFAEWKKERSQETSFSAINACMETFTCMLQMETSGYAT